jgi:hypothetical protein
MKVEFSWVILEKKTKKSYFMKIIQSEPSCFLLADRRTYMRKLIVPLCNFAKAPKTAIISVQHQLIGFYNRDVMCLMSGTK